MNAGDVGTPGSSVFPRGTGLPTAERASGCTIWDASGKSYIDAAGGALVVSIGHGDERVIESLADQARRVSYVHGTQFANDALERYTDEAAAILPMEDARVYTVSGGSEATETALKMARSYHLARGDETRHKIIGRLGSYHGNSLNALDASGRASLRAPYLPWLGHAVHVRPVNEYRCEWPPHDRCGQDHAELLDEAIRREGPDTVACFIAEPVVGATLAAAVPPDDYWPAVTEVCREHGVLLIADEVMTGFGRTGRWFGCDHWGVRPDILTAAKGASSGYWPFGFAACTEEVYETIARRGFVHGFTFSHSPVGAAVAGAVLKRLEEGRLVEASRDKGELLLKEVAVATGGHAHVGDVRGRGLMIGVEFVADRIDKRPFDRSSRVTERVLAAAKARGLLLYPAIGCADGVSGDAVMIGPPFVVTEEEIAAIVERLSAALEDITWE
jgi:adenosylmethionine-8-amino-7-oxononanoate aminotransferase